VSDWVDFSYTGRIKTRPTEYLQRDPQKEIPEAFAAFISPLDEREEVEKKIYLTQSVYNAYGIELDRFGGYVGLERGVMDDDTYRREILRRRFTLGGSGTEPDISKLAQAISNYGSVSVVEHYPAAYMVHISSEVVPSDICQILDQASAAGVRAYSTHDYGSGGFRLAGINTASGEALKVAEETALQAGTGREIMGLNRGQSFLSGSRLATSRLVEQGVGGYLQANDDIISDSNGNRLYVGQSDYSTGTGAIRLCGAMPKEDK